MANENTSQTSETKTMPAKGWFGSFDNPWDTWKPPSNVDKIKWLFSPPGNKDVTNVEEELRVTLSKNNEDYWKDFKDPKLPGIRFIWIGHASCLVQMDGVTFLTDPVFSERCSFHQGIGPKRYRPVPFEIEDIPDGLIDAVVISHNHYDHLDKTSVQKLQAKCMRDGKQITWLVPQNLKPWFTARGFPADSVKEHMWWSHSVVGDVEFHFTPAQHWSYRTYIFDKNKSLWGSWSVKGPSGLKFFFAGDTGYCKVFKEIREQFKEFDLAAIPIGSYKPREMMKGQHVDPGEAIQIHQDIKSKKSIGIHWGTFHLGYEEYMEPKAELEEQMKIAKLDPYEFITVYHGKTFQCESIQFTGNSQNNEKTQSSQNEQNTENSQYDKCTKSVQKCSLSESISPESGSHHQESNVEQ